MTANNYVIISQHSPPHDGLSPTGRSITALSYVTARVLYLFRRQYRAKSSGWGTRIRLSAQSPELRPPDECKDGPWLLRRLRNTGASKSVSSQRLFQDIALLTSRHFVRLDLSHLEHCATQTLFGTRCLT